MAICNLFKKLTKTTGNFMLFSLYTEDLTKASTSPEFYRVVPSKFIVMNVKYDTPKLKMYNNDLNIAFPLYLQNAFENGCALKREQINENNIDLNTQALYNSEKIPHWSGNIFWNAMNRAGLLNINNEDIIENIHYIGDINLLSYNEYEGMGYNEIYCFIPTDVYKLNWIGKFDNNIKLITTTSEYIEGFNEKDESEFHGNWTIRLKENPTSYDYGKYLNFNLSLDVKIYDDFNFNTIIILYDVRVKNKNGRVENLYSDIPMGIYLTGIINNDGTVTNSKTKYINRSELYDSGTSYGLRLCSRFISSPNSDNLKVAEISTENTSYSLYCQLMSKMADTLAKMDEILKQIYIKDIKYKELYSLFKNSRTNVPYIKEINGGYYWFVNGRLISEIPMNNNGILIQ